MSQEHISLYALAWNDYRKRRKMLWYSALGIFAIMAILNFFVSNLAVPILGPIWMVATIVSYFRLLFFRCPRCHHTFFVRWSFMLNNWFARRCMHCGLPKWSKDDTPETTKGVTIKCVMTFYLVAIIVCIIPFIVFHHMGSCYYNIAVAAVRRSDVVNSSLGNFSSIKRMGFSRVGNIAHCYFRIKGSKADSIVEVVLKKDNGNWIEDNVKIRQENETLSHR